MGAGAETLEQCPNWEQRKHVAFGATILVPTLFAFIACAYAVSTLTDNWQIIIPVAAAWGFIILTIDRSRAEIIEEMSRTFYASLRGRLASFFDDPQSARAAASVSPKG